MKKIKKIISGFVLLSLIVLNTGVNFTHIKKAQADGEILVSVAPSASNVLPGESFTVDIVVNPQGIDDILAIQTNFEFDPSLVRADSVTLTELADPSWSDSCDPPSWCNPGIDNVAGIIGSWISVFPSDPVFPSTTFTLLTIGMTAKTGVSGESYLRLPDSKHEGINNDLLFVGSDGPLPYDLWPYDLTIGSITVVASDATSPAIADISSTASDGLYKAGQIIAITATFDENVTVAGTPQITLETGATDRIADYASGTETNVLTFNYTIQSGDTSNDLDYADANSLSSNGGTIKDAAGNDAALTLPNPGEAGSLGANKDIAIDAVLPAITLLGNNPVNLYAGDTYIDAGAAALDNIDGDITSNIITVNPVNTAAAGTYAITYNVSDAAGNLAEEVTRTVIVSETPDTTPPTLAEVTPIPTPTSDNTPSYTFASDEAGIIAYSGGCVSDDTTEAIAGNNTIIFNTLGDGLYDNCAIIVTDANNNESVSLVVSAFTVDTVAPTGTITINGGAAYTNNRDVILTISATDNLSGIADMRVANGSSYRDWELYITSKAWTLSEGDGSKIVRVQFRDQAGNETSPGIPAYIILDATSPTGSISNASGSLTNDVTPALNFTIVDSGAGIEDAQIRFSCDNSSWTDWESYSASKENFNIRTGAGCEDADGNKTVYVQFKDSLGNTSISYNTGSFVLDTISSFAVLSNTPPQLTNQNSVDIIISGTDVVYYKYKLDEGEYNEEEISIEINIQLSGLSDGERAVFVIGKDKAGNWQKEESATVYTWTIDIISPVITLLGNNPVNLYAGETYTDAGAAALDNIDGDITSNIITVNPVNTAAAGTYVITYNVSDSAGNPAQQTTRTVAILPVEQSQAPIEQSMTVSANAPEILIGDNAPSSAIINVPSEVANARLNVSTLVSGDSVKSAVIPLGLTVNSSTSAGEVNLQIPQGIQINGDSSWTGEINLPQIKENSSVNIIPDSGYSAETSLVIEIGFGDVLLNFNKAVRIKIAGQAGKYVGYARNGAFTQITNICSADSQAAGDALPEGAECKIDVGFDLIIWTKHFTKFATYMQTAIVSAPASTGGGGIIYNYSAAIDYQRLAEKTIGALAKEKISVKNTGTGRLNPGTLTITFSAEYLALNLANLNWKSYDSNTGIAIWETPALDYAKEYILDIELLPLRAGQNIITSLAYHTINTDTLASIADAIEPAAEETPANAASEDESAATGASASEEINESGISAQSSTTETFYMEGATSASSSWVKNKETTEISDRTAAEEATEKSKPEDNLTNELSETGTESEEGEVKGIESDKENLVEEGNKESKEKESKNIKEIIQGVISGYWWLGALMIIFGSLGYYYLGRGRSGGKL